MRFLLFLPVCFAVFTCSAQQSAVSDSFAVETAAKAIRPNAIRAHMRFLSDSMLEGRAPGTRGYDIAAKYVAAQMEALSLQPAGERGTWFQNVPMRKSVNVAQDSSFTLSGNGKELKLKQTEDFAYLGDLSRTQSDVEAPVVFVGYGVTAPDLKYDDYAGVDVRGKIVAFLTNAPPRFPASLRGFYSDDVIKSKNAADHGAVGILEFMLPDDEKRYSPEIRFTELSTGNLAWVDAKSQPSEAFPEIRGWAILSRHGAELLFENAPKKLEEVYAAADASQPQAFPLAWNARLHTASSHSSLVSANIIGKITGSDAVLRNEFVVYTAHVDHLGTCPPVDGDNVCHGALDNASAVGTLLEIARAYAALPRAPRRSILFLFVTAEEIGDMESSDYFAHYPTVSKESIVADINIDVAPGMVFYGSKLTAIGAEHSSLNRNAEKAAQRTGYELIADVRAEENLFIRSDHYSFVKQGIPAVQVRNGGYPSEEIKKSFAGHYHTPLDNMERPINYDAGAKAAGMIFLLGYDVAQQDQRPMWNSKDFFGRTFASAKQQEEK
jgi:peptidase M28-like protein